MSWDAVGASAELVGAIGVILSLVYLALQIRQNTAPIDANSNLMRAESRRHWKIHTSQVNLAIAQDPDLTASFRRGLADLDSLEPDERIRFVFVFSEMLSAIDTAVYEEHSGVSDVMSDEGGIGAVRGLLRTPGGRAYWRSHGRLVGTPAFRSWVESEVLGDTPP